MPLVTVVLTVNIPELLGYRLALLPCLATAIVANAQKPITKRRKNKLAIAGCLL